MSVPETCRAAVLMAPNQPLQILDVEIPDHLEDGALLVRTEAATVCASDVKRWTGEHAAAGVSDGPLILGHEMTGRIVKFGDGARTDSVGAELATGDRIVWSHGFCGRCIPCAVDHAPSLCTNVRLYMNESCRTYPFLCGGFSEYVYVFPTSGRVKVPDAIASDVASASSCALRTIVHGFERLGPVDERDTIVIQGSGPLGLFATAKAVRSAASKVVVIGGPAARLDLARQWGAHLTIDIAAVPDPMEREQIVRDATDGRGADIAIQVAGVAESFNEGISMMRSGGRYLIIGGTPQTVPFGPGIIMSKQLTIIGSRSGGIDHYFRALEFLVANSDRFQWSDMISSHHHLEDINVAMAGMQTWTEIKPAIDFSP